MLHTYCIRRGDSWCRIEAFSGGICLLKYYWKFGFQIWDFSPGFRACIVYSPEWVTFAEVCIRFLCFSFLFHMLDCVALPVTTFTLRAPMSHNTPVYVLVSLVGCFVSNFHGVLLIHPHLFFCTRSTLLTNRGSTYARCVLHALSG